MSERSLPPVGGQAVIEGVMMRGPAHTACAVRRVDGSIALRIEELPSWSGRYANVPLVRGVAGLYESMKLGIRNLRWSAAAVGGGDEVKIGGAGSVALALVITIVVFFACPALIALPLKGAIGGAGVTLVESFIRFGLLVGYLALLRRHVVVQRLFANHGAEHKAVAAYEEGAPLTPTGARPFSTRHLRCGTTFLLDVAVLAAIVHLVVAVMDPSAWWIVASRILTVPVVAAFAYEVLRVVSNHPDAGWSRAIAEPGLRLQALTTAEPDDDQLEIALVALQAALTGVSPLTGEGEPEPGTPVAAAV